VTLTAQTGSCVQTRTFAIIGSGFKKQQESAILNSDAVQIYPNPATSNQVLIELPKNLIVDAPLSIKVRDVDGKIVSEFTSIEPTIALNIQNISNGIYTIFVQSNDNIVTKKLIIQH
jgi:hypothetical protein